MWDRARHLLAAAFVVVLAHAADARGQNIVTSDWLAATDGTWHHPARWSTNPQYPNNGNPPGTEYAVRITPAGAPYLVTIENPTTVNSVLLGGDAILRLLNFTTLSTTALTIGERAQFRVLSGRLTGATVTTSGNGRFESYSQAWLRDVYLNGQASIPYYGEIILEGSTHFGPNGAIHLSSSAAEVYVPMTGLVGEGEVVFDYGSDSQTSVRASGTTLTIGSGMTIRSAGGWGSILGQQAVNHGRIVADAQGGALFFSAVLDNRGTIAARNGARITMPDAWTNSGTVAATDNGILAVGNIPADTDLGSFFVRGSRLALTAPTTIERIHQLDVTDSILQLSFALDNTARVFPVRDGTNTWQVIGGSLSGGTVVEGAAGTVLVTGGTVSLAADVQADIHVIPGGNLTIGGGRIAGRTIRMNSGPDASSPFTGATVQLASTDLLEAGSRVVFDGTLNSNVLRRGVSGAFHVPAGVQVVTGTGGGAIGPAAAITNDGYIGSVTSGRAVTFNTSSVANAGTLEAGAGDMIALGPMTQTGRIPVNFTNSGAVRLGVGGDLNVTGSFLQQGDAASADFVIGGHGDEDFGQIFASASVALDGMLEASLADQFEPVFGDVFTIIRSGPGGVSGTFDEVHLPVWGDGMTFVVAYGAQQVNLVVVPEPAGAAALMGIAVALWVPRRSER